MTESEYLVGLRAAERDVIGLADVLDGAVIDGPFSPTLLALAQRSRSYMKGFIYCSEGPAPVAAMALLRPMVEINILIRFLSTSPVLHVELWRAESDRIMLAIHDEYGRSGEMTRKWGPNGPLSDEERAEGIDRVARARCLAIDAGLPGIGESGAVFPSISNQLSYLNDPAAHEAYTLAYRPLSADVHGGHYAFKHVELEVLPAGFVRLSEVVSLDELLAARTLALTTFASILCMASVDLGLGIEDAANEVKQRYMQAG